LAEDVSDNPVYCHQQINRPREVADTLVSLGYDAAYTFWHDAFGRKADIHRGSQWRTAHPISQIAPAISKGMTGITAMPSLALDA
jgi:hypothetical protein